MPTFVYMENYRGFASECVPLKCVNFLVGENSTGKTSFIELLEMFCYPPFWMIEPRFGVPGSHTRHFYDLVSASSKSKKKFTVGSVTVPGNSDESCCGMIVTYENSEGRPVPRRVSIIDTFGVKTVVGRLWISRKGEKYKARARKISFADSNVSSENRLRELVSIHHSNASFAEREITDEMQGSPLFMRSDDSLFEKSGGGGERDISVPEMFRTNLIELAPIRTKPRRTYDAPQTEFSPEGDHTPYVIRKRLSSKTLADKFSTFLEKIGKDSGLFEGISVKSYGNDAASPFEIRISLGRAILGLNNVGYGVSQALPVIVEMFVRPMGTMFTIQQPEVHLHPKAQASIGDLVAEISREEKKQFVIETHSDFTIDRFRLNVRKNGDIPSQLLFFKRNETGNQVTVIEIDKIGNLTDSQPDSYRSFFFNESLSLLE